MFIRIYQVREDSTKRIKFECYRNIQKEFDHIPPEEYKCVFAGYLDDVRNPEAIYQKLNIGPKPRTYQGHSLSVSDIIELHEDDETNTKRYYFCDSFGFVEMFSFDTSRCGRMDGVRVVFVEPGHRPYVTYIPDDLESLQNAVSDHGEDTLLEEHHPFKEFPRVALMCNECGNALRMPRSGVYGGIAYCGPLIFAHVDTEGNLCDLTEQQINTICR